MYKITLYILLNPVLCLAFPDPVKWDFTLDKQTNDNPVAKSLFKDSQIFIQIQCVPSQGSNVGIMIEWVLYESTCWPDPRFDKGPDYDSTEPLENGSVNTIVKESEKYPCNEFISLAEVRSKESSEKPTQESKDQSILPKEETVSSTVRTSFRGGTSIRPQFTILKDGFYILNIKISSDKKVTDEGTFTAKVHIEMHGKYGYLSAADWPLLPFYGAMCLVYVILGVAWLVVSFLQWRDLLRIQFWIGGVILLGMLEMATYYAEYSSINSTGDSTQSAVLLAEFVSCGKRTLARMLVIIVSLGFGIVKPRLGPMLHRVVGVGILHFILAATEAYMRIMRPKNDPSNPMLVASVPLAVLDSIICWWIFTSLVQTTRTLRLRRNLVKLALYRHFTNTLIFAVIASVIFMLYSIKAHHFTVCFTDWKDLWIDDAYWRLLFSVILLVIMILWRPTNNNQRYAFSPLLDAPEDDDDEEEDQFVNDAYGVKMRGQSSGAASPKPKTSANSEDEDLKWVEENIPASLADSALPILDSEEEKLTTRFELSKMQ